MKRLVAVVVLVLLAFYVVWPGWSAWQLSSAIKARDSATLERKILFPEVRESLRPATIQKIGEIYDQQVKAQLGPAGAPIASQVKSEMLPRVVDTALNQMVTAPNLIRVVNDAGPMKENAERIIREQIARIGLPGLGGSGGGGGSIQLPGGIKLPGGLGEIAGKMNIPGFGGAPKQEPAAPPSGGQQHPGFGLGNIKRFSFLGPLAFEIGVAKDAQASEADVTVVMRFTGGDWRVVGVRPRV